MDIADWLRQLGLGQYETVFRENEISADLLPNLTAEDLKELGVTAVGHRRRLLDAILVLRTGAISSTALPPAPIGVDGDRQATSDAERRHITVLFCDIVGSTPLSGRLDPEDLRSVIGAYQRSIAAVVSGLRGTIARFVGDGVLVYFGWPNTDETHAESAVHAALAIIKAVQTQGLAVRIGIATGLVVVDDLIDAGAPQRFVAVGETPNLAARLQGLAEPNTIVVSKTTRSQISKLFEVEDIGAIELKGFDAPQHAWRVLRETALASRSEVLYSGALTPLIGRDNELELLLHHWQHAKTGEGRVVLLSGEPGIGKSRLIAELEERLLTAPHSSLHYFCSPYRQDTALHPVITGWERDLGFIHSDTSVEGFAKLEAELTTLATPPEDIRLIADLLSLSAAHHPSLELSPLRRKQRIFTALCHTLEMRAATRPVLMLFEDAHWADQTSLELIDTLIGRLSDIPVLLVVSFRTEFTAPWVGQAGVSLITLSRLTRHQAVELAIEVSAERVLPQLLLERVVTQSDGVPLFIEELTKAVLETTDASPDTGSFSAVPATLQSSLMARLDRLPAAKLVAQIGAVIGRDFSHTLLATVSRLPQEQLALGLEELVASGLASCRGAPPDADYTFKHALVRDAAYESLLRSRRADIHAAIVQAMERDPYSALQEPEVLGYHCAQAGLVEKAASYYRKAAATPQRLAQVERLLQRALELDPSSVTAMTTLAHVIMERPRNFGQPIDTEDVARAKQLISRAKEIGGSDEDVVMAGAYLLRHQLRFAEARDAYQGLVDRNPGNATAHMMLGICLTELGCVEAAIPHYESALRLDPSDQLWLKQWRMGEALLFLGRDTEAIPWFRQALVANPNNTANNRSYINLALAGAHSRLGQLDLARLHVSEANQIWPFFTVRSWRRHLPFTGLAARVELVREELRRAGLRDHADEDVDFGVPATRNLENEGFGRTPTTAPGVTTIRTNELIILLAQSKPLVISPMSYHQRSIPGTVGLKFAGAGGSLVDRLQDRLRRKMVQLMGGNAGFPIVTLGWNSESWSGRNLALRLVALGYTNVNWYRGGLEAWEVRELPETDLDTQEL